MFKPHYGDCKNPDCERKNVPIVVKDGWCDKCHHERKQAKKKAEGKKTGRYVYKKEASGELQIFNEIWNERPHVSEVSGKKIVFDVCCFSHVLSKGAYPSYRLEKINIVLVTKEEHHLWETQKHKLKDLPEWKFKFDLEQFLKEKYYKEIVNLKING